MTLKLLEEVGLEETSYQSMFRSHGGYRAAPSPENPKFKRGMLETANVLKAAYEGEAPAGTVRNLMEAQGTEDFQWYMGHILQRRTYGMYSKMSGVWRPFCRTSTVPDFRPVERLWMDDGSSPMPFLQQREEYSYSQVTGDSTTYQIAKYGRLMSLTWEALIDDDLNFLTDFPATLARSAVQTEDLFVTNLYASSSGPNTSVFSTANGNLLAANADLGTAANNALSVDAINAAIHQLNGQTIAEDDNSLPIMFDRYVVVVPRALELTVNFIQSARELRTNANLQGKGGQEYTFIIAGNGVGNVTFIVNPYLDILGNSNAWYMFAVPQNARPGIEVAFLRGHTRPQIFMRTADSRAIGSGDTRGSFENDTLDYKLRGVFGGTVIDHRQMLASAGTG